MFIDGKDVTDSDENTFALIDDVEVTDLERLEWEHNIPVYGTTVDRILKKAVFGDEKTKVVEQATNYFGAEVLHNEFTKAVPSASAVWKSENGDQLLAEKMERDIRSRVILTELHWGSTRGPNKGFYNNRNGHNLAAFIDKMTILSRPDDPATADPSVIFVPVYRTSYTYKGVVRYAYINATTSHVSFDSAIAKQRLMYTGLLSVAGLAAAATAVFLTAPNIPGFV
eukprot:TRINITY_DN5625_c0_g1_i2.p1 TRINITY_DN5625_c0_g1~~TRINITY_DN5625_c0_g1_i2.p1  ORF type:complete len:226 (-),score=33.07 TRINITY_DN5625_c0_g1_i2:51-728(-)